MGWIVDGPTVEIHAQGQTGSLQITSTSTVALGPADLGGAAARLRLYGVGADVIARSVPAAGAWGKTLAADPCGLKGRAISYLDSQLFAPFRFVVDRAGSVASTCVVNRHEDVSWPVRMASTVRSLTMDVMYKDVTVARLPDASWLMVAGRYRTLASGPPEAMPGRSLGDVVAWRASDPGFTKNLTGPHWLVDGQAAFPGQTTPAWLGVPSAVVVGSGRDARIDVYYTYQVDNQYGRPYPESALEGTVPALPGPQSPTTSGPPPSSPTPRGPAPGRPSAGGYPQITQGTAVKRFQWADLQGPLSRPSAAEARWEAGGPLSGLLLGTVRVWTPADLPGTARSFTDAFSRVRIVDPAPIPCGGPSDLFFAAIHEGGPGAPRGADDAHGIWHASGLPTGAVVCADNGNGCTVTPAIEGLDFLVAPGGVSSRSRLLATSPQHLYLDPDPVRLPNGALRVAAGDMEKTGGLTSVSGPGSAVCQPWSAAWQR